jgi:hypothetical protein
MVGSGLQIIEPGAPHKTVELTSGNSPGGDLLPIPAGNRTRGSGGENQGAGAASGLSLSTTNVAISLTP